MFSRWRFIIVPTLSMAKHTPPLCVSFSYPSVCSVCSSVLYCIAEGLEMRTTDWSQTEMWGRAMALEESISFCNTMLYVLKHKALVNIFIFATVQMILCNVRGFAVLHSSPNTLIENLHIINTPNILFQSFISHISEDKDSLLAI